MPKIRTPFGFSARYLPGLRGFTLRSRLWAAILMLGMVSTTVAQPPAPPSPVGETGWGGYGLPGNLPVGMAPAGRVVGGGGFADLASSAETKPEGPPGVLLLKTGMVVRGEIVPTEKSYEVKTDFGSLNIPKANVEKVGRDLMEIYRYKKLDAAPDNWQDLMNLAEWAVANGLVEQGYADYAQSLQAAPNERIRSLVDFRIKSLGPKPGSTDPPVQDALAGENAAAQVPALPAEPESPSLANIPTFGIGLRDAAENTPEAAPARAMPGEGEGGPWEEDLGIWSAKVPHSVVEGFTKKVQPILVNRCGSADCHGSDTQSRFCLTTPRRFGSSATLKNLRETMRFIDPNNPPESPLLAYSTQSHGGGKAGFPRKNHFQYDAVQAWLFHVAGSPAVRRHNLLASQPFDMQQFNETSPIRQAANLERLAQEGQVPQFLEFEEGAAEARLLNSSASSLPELSPDAETGIGSTTAPWLADPLDPELFNRKYHPHTTRSAARKVPERVLR